MRSKTPAPPDSADVAALAAALRWDQRLTNDERAQVDRRVPAQTRGDRGGRTAAGQRWLDAATAHDPELGRLRSRLRGLLQSITALLFGAGVVLGALATLGAFYYDGGGRVNVVAVLGALVLLPALLLLPFAWAALPARWLAWIPGHQALHALSRALNPARPARALLRRLPQAWRETVDTVMFRSDAHQMLYADLQKWNVLRWSQVFALAFQGAAVTTAGGLILFSDLVFGWSTTLASGDPQADAATVERITTLLATPWSAWLEVGRPTLELVADSRYYRAVTDSLSTTQAARLGQWWPFVLLSMVTYGLLPRLLTLGLCEHRLRRAARVTFAQLPGLTAVLNRLHQGQVRTRAEGTESPPASPAEPTPAGTPAPLVEAATATTVFNWAAVPVAAEWIARRFPQATTTAVGGDSSLEADESAARAAVRQGAPGPVAILVKSWEPPVLEFIDFVRFLRQQLGQGREILVLPLGLDDARGAVAAPPAAFETWRRQLARAGDPWLHTLPIAPTKEAPKA